ncbi:MAG TPA: GNAT family N-acetyltransferase [Fimbriimonadaceae bacterium]
MVEIELVTKPTSEVRELVSLLEEELAASYPPEQRHGLKVEAIFQPHIRFVIARLDGQAVGCGGVALFSDFGELKRMFVRAECRGKRIADAIIGALESEAKAANLSTVRLETGTEQFAAIRFYIRCGYIECAAFEPYASMQPHQVCTSVFFEKQL